MKHPPHHNPTQLDTPKSRQSRYLGSNLRCTIGKRMYSILGYTSPMAFEENWRRQQEILVAKSGAVGGAARGQGHYGDQRTCCDQCPAWSRGLGRAGPQSHASAYST